MVSFQNGGNLISESHGIHSVLSRSSAREKSSAVGSCVGKMGSSPGFELMGWGKSEVDMSGMEGADQHDSVQWGSCSFKVVV